MEQRNTNVTTRLLGGGCVARFCRCLAILTSGRARKDAHSCCLHAWFLDLKVPVFLHCFHRSARYWAQAFRCCMRNRLTKTLRSWVWAIQSHCFHYRGSWLSRCWSTCPRELPVSLNSNIWHVALLLWITCFHRSITLYVLKERQKDRSHIMALNKFGLGAVWWKHIFWINTFKPH